MILDPSIMGFQGVEDDADEHSRPDQGQYRLHHVCKPHKIQHPLGGVTRLFCLCQRRRNLRGPEP